MTLSNEFQKGTFRQKSKSFLPNSQKLTSLAPTSKNEDLLIYPDSKLHIFKQTPAKLPIAGIQVADIVQKQSNPHY